LIKYNRYTLYLVGMRIISTIAYYESVIKPIYTI